MICPNCRRDNTLHLETWETGGVEEDYRYCWDCDFMWKMEDGNFIAGAVISGDRQDFPAFDDMEVEIVKKLNLEDLDLTCIYCESTVIRSADRRRYECTMCGSFWEWL